MMSGITGALVLSTGRCGSTLLSTLLRAHPDVLSLSELFSMSGGDRVLQPDPLEGDAYWRRFRGLSPDLVAILGESPVTEVLSAPHLDSLTEANPLSLVTLPHLGWPLSLTEIEAELARHEAQPAGAHLLQLFEWMCQRQGKRVWVERSGGSIEYAQPLLRAFPQARVIHLLRDGRACAFSMSKHPMFRVRVARLVARDPELPATRCLDSELPPDRFGAYWSCLMHEHQRALSCSDAPALVIRYEALVQRPREQIRRLAAFLDLSRGVAEWERTAEQTVELQTENWRSLPEGTRGRLERACRPGLRLLKEMTHTVSV